jgi:hypothetical protein
MTIESWQALGIVCGSIIALITVAGLLRRKVIVPMLETVRLVSTLVRQLVGDKDSNPPRPSLMEVVAGVQTGLAEQAVELAQVKQAQADLREEWQSFRGRPAPVPSKPNGQRGR